MRPRRSDPIFFRTPHLAVSRVARTTLDLADVPPGAVLRRHQRGDWGLLRDDDARENEHALRHAGDLVSEFELSTGAHILCLTTGDRQLTSVLCPAELCSTSP